MLESRNFAPRRELLGIVRRHYVFDAALPDDFELRDILIAENTFVRILLRGDWAAEIEPGHWTTAGPIVLFGGNSRPLPVRVRGPFTVVGFAFRPSAWRAVFSQPASDFTDRMVPLAEAWGPELANRMLEDVKAAPTDLSKIVAIEDCIIDQMHRIGRPRIDAEMQRFEEIARLDSTARIEFVAQDLGMSTRQMERRCLQTFGLTPKSVLRRSRFLDMAAAMRGFSSPDEAVLAKLRYFDESHLNREFRHYTGMTPGAFSRAITPLMTAGLKLREEGKLLS